MTKHSYYPAAAAMEVSSVELGHTAASKCFDDDGRPKRTGKDDRSLSRAEAWHGGQIPVLLMESDRLPAETY